MQKRPHFRATDRRASELLRKFRLHRVPVDVHSVAEHLGAKVVYEDVDDDVSGLLLCENGVSTIVINRQHPPNRQRFTLAHECGHLYLHADRGDRLWVDKTLFFRDASSSTGDHRAEIEANQFAAGLLMPGELVLSAFEPDHEFTEADVVRLALRFEVSERAMTVRLISLGLIASVAA
jgi:Zn-dependent peptidase ImmA (M78 family)